MTNVRRQLSAWLPFLLLTVFFLAEQIRILFGYASHHTNNDQTLLWYAAKEFIHGRLHEPNFYGQQYNTIFESIPGAVLHLIGIPFGLAIPISTMFLVTGVWVILAVTAYRKGKHKIALLALAAPVIMRVQYLVLFDAPRGILAGDFLAVVAATCALWLFKDSVMKLTGLIALGGVAMLWDYAAAFIVVPVFLYILCREWPQIWSKPKRIFLFAIISALPPTGWLLFQQLWRSSHPYDITASSISGMPHWAVFLQSIHHFSSYLAFFAPTLAPIPEIAAVLFCVSLVCIILIAIKRRSYGLFFSAFSLVLLICLALSLPKANDYLPDLYLSASRLLLTLPLAGWLLILLLSLDKDNSHHAIPQKYKKSDKTPYKDWLVVGIATISFGVTQFTFNSTIMRSVYLDLSSLADPSIMTTSCQKINQVYSATNAQLFATNNQSLAYGCAAQHDSLNTLVPVFDRRGWIIKTSYTEPIKRILITGSSCNIIVLAKSAKCTAENYRTLLIQTPPTPAAATLSTLGLPVRIPFRGIGD